MMHNYKAPARWRSSHDEEGGKGEIGQGVLVLDNTPEKKERGHDLGVCGLEMVHDSHGCVLGRQILGG